MTPNDITIGCKEAVSTYLLARVYAEAKREQVDKIERQILQELNLTDNLLCQHAPNHVPSKITDPKHVYCCVDKELTDKYYFECNKREREQKVKDASLPDSHCPALVAENLQSDAEHLVVEEFAKVLEKTGGLQGKSAQDFADNLILLGLEKYHKFIDLCVGLVVNMPDFESPMKKLEKKS